ncbi:hypothetical protein [Vibrio sp. WXL103]|uniref:hypothetical protein n=1 Tax=unclassified Vibrio TaxID=2614977 RepID=UPI003EC66E41
MHNFPKPLNLPLATQVYGQDESIDKDEWETVLVPVIPFYERNSSIASFTSGYIYVVWRDEVWRELKVLDNGYFSDIDVNYYRQLQPGTKATHRFADIILSDPETGFPLSYAEFDVLVAGKVKFKGRVDVYGKERLFGFEAEEVEIRCHQGDFTFTIKTQEAPNWGGKYHYREAGGMPLPHILLPYKVASETQSVFMYHSPSQLSLSELKSLESDPEALATSLDGLSQYSDSQSFVSDEGEVRELIPSDGEQHYWIEKYVDSGVAAVVLNPPTQRVRLTYRVYEEDQPDDCFILRDRENNWEQRITIREMELVADGVKAMSFSGWPKETQYVSLTRLCRGEDYGDQPREVVIYDQVELVELFNN